MNFEPSYINFYPRRSFDQMKIPTAKNDDPMKISTAKKAVHMKILDAETDDQIKKNDDIKNPDIQ